MARDAGCRAVLSQRSGGTENTLIGYLVVAIDVGQIKSGAPACGERVANYSQLLGTEEALGERAPVAGRGAVAAATKRSGPRGSGGRV